MNKESNKKSRDRLSIDLICVAWTGGADMEVFPAAAKELGLFALALYGAILSTINWRYQARSNAVQVKVLARVMPAHGGEPGPSYAKVAAINIGPRPVTIEILTLELPSGARLFTPYNTGISGLESTR